MHLATHRQPIAAINYQPTHQQQQQMLHQQLPTPRNSGNLCKRYSPKKPKITPPLRLNRNSNPELHFSANRTQSTHHGPVPTTRHRRNSISQPLYHRHHLLQTHGTVPYLASRIEESNPSTSKQHGKSIHRHRPRNRNLIGEPNSSSTSPHPTELQRLPYNQLHHHPYLKRTHPLRTHNSTNPRCSIRQRPLSSQTHRARPRPNLPNPTPQASSS
jgi:hypothetical protein